MKNAKKILGILLALVALTLVMSLSIFAEDATEPTVYEFNDANSFKNAINSAQAGDIIRMTANTTVAQLNDTGAVSAGAPTNKAVIIDLNGFTLTTTGSWGGAYIGGGASIINGTIKHTGNTCAIKACNMDRIEDVTIIVESSKSDTGGISMRNHAASGNYAHINTIKNVKMIGTGNYGIETYGQGEGVDKTKPVIDLMENVEIDSIKYGLDLSCSIGTIKDCVISGSQAGISCKLSNSFVIALNFVGDNDIMGSNCAVTLSTYVTITADKYTDFVNVNGGTVFSASATVVNGSTLDIVGYNVVDGVLVECEHNITGGSCTERAECSVCTKVFDYVHTWVEDESKRVLPNCTVQGKAYYTCECGATQETFIPRDPDAHEWVVTSKAGSCTEDAVDSYNCKYGSCVGEEYTVVTVPAPGHKYDAVVTDPTCEEDGFTTYTCSVCGDTYTEPGETATGHNYVAGEEVDGVTVYTCTNCGDSYTCLHEYSVIESADPTCASAGYIKSECTLCGSVKEEIVPATAHTYDWKIVGCPACGTLAVLDEGSTNVSSNLGYTIYFATTLNDLSNTNYDVIRLKNNISLPSGGKITNPNAIIDLGGNVLYRNGGYLGLRIVSAKGFVNGYVYKTNGGSQIMAVTSLEFMEDITLSANSTKTNNATGLLMNTAGAYLGSMKNVTICAGVLSDLNSNNFDFVNVGTNGIYNHGIEATQGTIGSMENVKISTYGQAITSAAKIGTMTNCVFSGDGMALNITKLHSEMKFVNCEIYSKNIAIYIADAVDSTEEAPVSFEIGNTKIITDGAVYALTDHIKGKDIFAGLTSAVALVNGQLYTSLEEAVNALKASTEEVTTFALIGDLAVDSTIVIDKKVNFSFGGATYNVPVYGTNQVVTQTAPGYTVTSTVDVIFQVVEGGYLTISGDGTLVGGENAIVADGGEIVIAAGTYVGYNPRSFVSASSCVVSNEGTYTIASEHDYDDEVGADKTNYQVDGVCNNCGYVRGIYAVDNVYYATLEEALAAALASGKQVVLAADIVIDGDVVWDFTGTTFNFNGLTVTVNGSLSIVGGTFTQDVSEYVAEDYCTYKNNKNLYIVTAPHTWTDATCTAPKTCTACGATEGEALGHSYFYPCDKVCLVCNEVTNPDATHNIVYVEAKAGTDCQTWDGNIEYWYCSDCGTAWADEANTQLINLMSVKVNGDHSYFSPCDKVCLVCNEVTNPDAAHNIVHVEAKAGTDCQTWDGNIEYWYCSVCGAAWADEANTQVINLMSVKVNGDHIYFSPCDKVCLVCNEVTNPDATHNIVHAEAKAGTDCQTWDGNIEYWYCSVCGAAWIDEALTQVTNPMSVKVNGDHNYVAGEPAEDGSVTYTCDCCGDSYTESVEHTHTVEIIPAVPGELRNPGMTSGLKCSECGEILLAPVTADADFRFAAVSLSLGESVGISYKAQIPAGFENIYVVFDFGGEKTVVSEYSIEKSTGRYVFMFNGVRLQSMADLVTATVYAEKDGVVHANSYSDYSVKTYIVNQLNKSTNSATLKTMLSDLLVLGAKTQVYMNYKKDNLMTADVEDILTPSTYAGVPADEFVQAMIVNDEDTRAIADWKSVSLTFTDAMALQFKLAIDANELENIEIKITLPGTNVADEVVTFTAEDLTYEESSGRYVLLVENIKALQYGKTVVGDIYHNGVQISRTVNYSVNSYIQKNQDSTNVALRDFLRAAYLYGEAVCAYNG